MLGQRYRIRFTLYRFPGLVVVLCDRWPTWTTSAPTTEDAIWEAAAHAVTGQGWAVTTQATATPEVAASAVVAAMERAWTAIRARHREVPEVIVILGAGSEARRGLFKLGHFAAARWQVADARRAEVLVSGEGLGRGAVDVLGTLLHEAAHGLADAREVQDTSRQGRYHNRRYAHLAAEVGLEVAHDAKTGWSQTTVPDTLTAAYTDELADLDAALKLWRYAEQQLPTSTTSRNLLACACSCGRKLRVAKATLEQAPIVCGACAEPFEPV